MHFCLITLVTYSISDCENSTYTLSLHFSTNMHTYSFVLVEILKKYRLYSNTCVNVVI